MRFPKLPLFAIALGLLLAHLAQAAPSGKGSQKAQPRSNSKAQSKPSAPSKTPSYKSSKTAKARGGKPSRRPERWHPVVSPGYQRAVAQWHQAAPPAKTDDKNRPFLTLEILNTGERIELAPQQDDGAFRASDLDRLAHALRDGRRGNEYPVDPRTVDIIYDIQKHFSSGAIRVISGYRTPHVEGHSNHGRGRAIDFIAAGTTDEQVAQYLRSKGFVGVGVYPTSGFVHVDIRPSSYFWIDRSGPGQRNREQATLAGLGATSDSTARAHGRTAPAPWRQPSSEVDSAVAGKAPAAMTDVQMQDDPEEDDLDGDNE